MINKSEKFRDLLENETTLRNQLDDCETAQYRMLKKAFKGLGLKIGCFSEMVGDQATVMIIETNFYTISYCRNNGVNIKTYEITLEDLFDAEVKE